MLATVGGLALSFGTATCNIAKNNYNLARNLAILLLKQSLCQVMPRVAGESSREGDSDGADELSWPTGGRGGPRIEPLRCQSSETRSFDEADSATGSAVPVPGQPVLAPAVAEPSPLQTQKDRRGGSSQADATRVAHWWRMDLGGGRTQGATIPYLCATNILACPGAFSHTKEHGPVTPHVQDAGQSSGLGCPAVCRPLRVCVEHPRGVLARRSIPWAGA